MLLEVTREKGKISDDTDQAASTRMACTSGKRRDEDSKQSAECPTADTLILNLSGSLAKRWIEEKGSADDISFLEYLLDVHGKYKQEQLDCDVDDKVHKVGLACSVKECSQSKTCSSIPNSSRLTLQKSQIDIEKSKGNLVEVEIDRTDLDVPFKEQRKEALSKRFANKNTERNLDSDLVEILINKSEDTVCEICQQKVIGETKRYHVFSEHFSLYVKCESCEAGKDSYETGGKNLIDVEEYFTHQNTAHGKHSTECPFCNKVVEVDAFSRHLIHMHWKKLFCLCDTCGVSSDSNTPLKGISVGGHLLKKHSTPNLEKVSCEICGAVVLQQNLAKHMKSVHEGAREICELCGKSFNDVNRHKKRVHIESPCKYQCVICNKKLTSRWNLTVHNRLHTGEKPFTCEVCGKSFHQKVELKLHVRNHHEHPCNEKCIKKKKIAKTLKPTKTGEKSTVSRKTKSTPGLPVSLSDGQIFQSMFSSNKSQGSSNVYTVIPSQPGNNARNVQNVTVFDVPSKDLCGSQLVWITAQSGEDVTIEGSS